MNNVEPTPKQIAAARARIRTYMGGYPEPMIDSRRWRIVNGEGTLADHQEIEAERIVLEEMKGEGTIQDYRETGVILPIGVQALEAKVIAEWEEARKDTDRAPLDPDAREYLEGRGHGYVEGLAFVLSLLGYDPPLLAEHELGPKR